VQRRWILKEIRTQQDCLQIRVRGIGKLVEQIATDIGKEAVMHVETMYPKAIEATPASFKVLCAT
jgi:hypothetical protein